MLANSVSSFLAHCSDSEEKGEEFETLLTKWGVHVLLKISDKTIPKERYGPDFSDNTKLTRQVYF